VEDITDRLALRRKVVEVIEGDHQLGEQPPYLGLGKVFLEGSSFVDELVEIPAAADL
jgi:hypothetical protein